MGHTSVAIRPFCTADTDTVVSLWRECGLVVPANDPHRDIQRKVDSQPELFLVGEHEGLVVATLMVGYDGHRGWLNYLAVSPGMRLRGVGSAMLHEAERLLRQRGCPKINLQVRTGNRSVIAFYQARGYRIDEVVGMGKRLVDDRHRRPAGPGPHPAVPS
jgi:ribosomal protein S18 acetylase RimI-like enzyme